MENSNARLISAAAFHGSRLPLWPLDRCAEAGRIPSLRWGLKLSLGESDAREPSLESWQSLGRMVAESWIHHEPSSQLISNDAQRRTLMALDKIIFATASSSMTISLGICLP